MAGQLMCVWAVASPGAPYSPCSSALDWSLAKTHKRCLVSSQCHLLPFPAAPEPTHHACVLTLPKENPPSLGLSLPSLKPTHTPPLSLHLNTVFISPPRLNPSLPIRCGKRHFENEIGYINSPGITLAIAFSLYSAGET